MTKQAVSQLVNYLTIMNKYLLLTAKVFLKLSVHTRKVSLAVLLLASAIVCSAQQNITGCVLDSATQKPLTAANVTLLRSGRAVSFVRTDAKGGFSIKAKEGDSFSVTFMGYGKKVVPVSQKRDYRVLMSPQEFTLREVQVKAGRVFGRQDTISFDLSQYASQRDNSLKDVLKKVPGVDVADNGQVSFNGKAVKRFTVENLDLTGGRYNALTEALKAQDVARAEIIEHDQPIKALRNKVLTDDVAMNIKLKAEARDKWMLTLKPAVVTSFPLETARPQGGVDALQIGKRQQRMYNARHDRSGQDLTRSNDVLAQVQTSGYDRGQDIPQWFSQPTLASPIDAERLRKNRSWDFSLKETRKRGEEGEQRITAGYMHTNERQQTENQTTLYLDPTAPQNTDEKAENVMRSDRLYLDFMRNTNTETAYGNEYFLLEGLRKEGLSQFNSSNTGSVTQQVKTPQLRLSNTFARIWPRKTHSLEFESVVDYRHSPMTLTVDEDEKKLSTTMFHTDEKVSLTLNRPFLTHRYTATLTAEHLRADGKNTLLGALLRPWWQYKRGLSRLVLSLPVKYSAFTDRKKQFVDASPSLLFNLKKGSRHELWSVVGLSQTTGGWQQFALSEYEKDYRTMIKNDGIIPRNGNLYASLSYDYKRTLAELFSSFSVSYNRTWRNLMTDMTVTDGRYLLNTIAKDNITEAFSAKAWVSKGFFSLHTKAKLDVEYSHAEGSQLSAGAVSAYSSNIITASPELTFSPRWGMFTYSALFNANALKTPNAEHKTLLNWIQRISYTHSIGHVDLSASAVHYRNELQSGTVATSFLADCSAILRLKKVRLSLTARNLFNKRSYIQTVYSGVTSSTTVYNLRPREVVAEAQISI